MEIFTYIKIQDIITCIIKSSIGVSRRKMNLDWNCGAANVEESNSDVRWVFMYSIWLVGLFVNGVVLFGVFFIMGTLLLLKSLF